MMGQAAWGWDLGAGGGKKNRPEREGGSRVVGRGLWVVGVDGASWGARRAKFRAIAGGNDTAGER